jgi:Zn-dependent protease with chaperone function
MWMVHVLFLLCCLRPLPAEGVPGAQPSPGLPATQTTGMPSEAGPTTVYALPPDKLAKAKTLYDLRGRLWIFGTAWSFAILLVILYLGVMSRYRDWAEKASRYSFVQAAIVVPLFLLTIALLELPLSAYHHSISLQYGLSVQDWGSWFGDQVIGQTLELVLGIIVLWLLIFLIRKSPRRWWLYLWLISIPVAILFATIMPSVIDPMFNKFEPLDKNNPRLVDAIERVTQRGGLAIPRDRMFMMKASEKVTTLNAYVTGFGPSKRVVVWDTTIQKSTTPEILFVFGHEMGHYVLNHVVLGLIEGEIGLLLGLYLLYRLSGWFLRRFGAPWHIRKLGDWAALPMIFLIFTVLGVFATPVSSVLSRQIEHNADVYGLEVTHGINANSQEAAAHAFQVLGELSLDYPYPGQLVVFWYYDHPPIMDRVRFAHEYDPWSKGEPTKYVR